MLPHGHTGHAPAPARPRGFLLEITGRFRQRHVLFLSALRRLPGGLLSGLNHLLTAAFELIALLCFLTHDHHRTPAVVEHHLLIGGSCGVSLTGDGQRLRRHTQQIHSGSSGTGLGRRVLGLRRPAEAQSPRLSR